MATYAKQRHTGFGKEQWSQINAHNQKQIDT